MSEKDCYAEHLAAVNEKVEVLTTEDICNSQGAVVVPKGTAVDPKIAEQIAKHKLIKPVECSVNLSESITGQTLKESFQGLCLSDS